MAIRIARNQNKTMNDLFYDSLNFKSKNPSLLQNYSIGKSAE
jgi:hypothetical protein